MQLDSDQDSNYFSPAALYLKVFILMDNKPKELKLITKLNIRTGEYWQYKTNNGKVVVDALTERAIVEHHKDDTLWVEFYDDAPIDVINFMMKHMKTLCN